MAMTNSNAPLGQRLALIAVIALCLFPIAGALAPRSLGLLPVIYGIIGYIACRISMGYFAAPPRKIVIAIGVLLGLMALSTLWAYDAEEALDRTIKIATLMIGGILMISIVNDRNLNLTKPFTTFFPYAVAIAGIIIMINLYGNSIIHDALRSGDAPTNRSVNLSHLNRSVVAYTFFSIAALGLLLKDQTHLALKIAKTTVLLLITLLILYKTHSQSAQIGFATACIAAVILPYRIRATWIILSAIIAVAMLSAPWTVQWAFHTMAETLHSAAWIKDGYAGDRLEIWNFISQRALQQPWIGFGVEATRAIDDFQSDMMYFKNTSVLHPHNFVMQIWIELGVLGVAIMAAIQAVILRHIWTQYTVSDRRIIMPLYCVVLIVSATGYGFWQSWLQGLYISLMTIAIVIAAAKPENKI